MSSNDNGTCGPLTGSTSYVIKPADSKSAGTIGEDEVEGYIYSCDSNAICTQIISSGYLDPAGTPTYLYTCDDGVCSLVDSNDLPAKSHYLVGSETTNTSVPYITYQSLIECETAKTISSCSSLASPSGYYKNSAAEALANNPKALILCTSSTKCSVVDGINNSFYATSGKKLIKCDNGGSTGCEIVSDLSDPTDYTIGYLLEYGSRVGETDYYSKLIACRGSPTIECSNPTSVSEGYYIDVATPLNIIQCVTSSGTTKCSTIPHGGSAESPKNFYDPLNKQVIQCNALSCTALDKTLKGYFLDSGNPSKVIKCAGSECSEISPDSACSRAGKVKKSGDAIYLCLSASDSDAHMRIESDSGLPEKTYKSVVSSNEFPGNNASGSFTVRNDNDGKVILMEENVLPPCGSQCTSQTNYCITGNIIKKGDSSNNCVTIQSNAQGSKALYFRKDYTLVSSPSNTPEGDGTTNVPDIAYMCTFGEDPYDATKCELIKGYTTSNTNMIYCSEWKNDPCTIVGKENELGDDSTCESIKKVKLIDTGKICTSIGGEAVSADKNIFLYPTEANEYYGIRMTSNNPDFVALSITKNEGSDVADTVVVISNASEYFY